MKYGVRTKYIESLIYSGNVSEEEKKLLQNGFIPEKFQSDYIKFSNNSYPKADSNIEPLIFGNYFHLNPEKVSGEMVEGSGYINPVKVKGGINDVLNAIKTINSNKTSSSPIKEKKYRRDGKLITEAELIRKIEKDVEVIRNEESIDDWTNSDTEREAEREIFIRHISNMTDNELNIELEKLEELSFGDSKARKLVILIKDEIKMRKNTNTGYKGFAKVNREAERNIKEKKASIQIEREENELVESVPSIIHNADAILHIDNNIEANKTFYTVEESVMFLNKGISDDELKAWVWYKRLHGSPMKGWDKWFIKSSEDKINKLVYAKEETELLGNNYKSIGFVPKGSLVGLRTKFENVYGENTFVVCKTQEGSLVWINKSFIEERNTVNTSSENDLIKLVENGALIYTGVEYLPIPIFLFGNFYEKLNTVKSNKDLIISKFNEDTYNNIIQLIEKYKPKNKSFAEPVISKRPFMSCLSEMANNVEMFGVLQLNEEVDIRLGHYKRNRFHETTEKISLFDAFQFYLSQYVKDTDIRNTNKANIRNYYFAKAVKWMKDEDGKDLLSESQKAELIGNARFEAERLFSDFLANGLVIEDRMKLDIEWNIKYNSISNVNNFVHKVPIGYEGSAMFKAGKLMIKPAQREGLAYLSIVGSGCLAYEVGFGKTACGILNLAQLLSQGKIKRPLLVVPKPTYKNWLKELFGYYSDGTKTELTQFEGSKYYYGVLSGTKYKLNDWYNLKAKTLKRLVAEYGSEENINKIVPQGTITIVSYQGFEQIGFSREVSEKVFNSIYEALSQKGNVEVEDREEAKEYQKIRELMGIAQKNTIVDIDKLGFDHLTVDEAHNFKNAFASCGKDPATGRKLFGIQANRSYRAVKMFFHTQYIQRYYGKNVVLLTATPFTNSPLEFFSMISYVGLDSLLNYNLWNIQKFFEQFVMQTVEYTVDVKGELKVKPVIKSIQNLSLFQNILFNLFHRKDDPKEAGVTRPCMYEIPNKDVSTHLDMNEFQLRNQANVRLMVNSYSKENKGAILKALSLSQNNAFSPFLAAKEQPEGAKDFVEQSPKIHYICECIKSVKEYHENRGEELSGQVIYSNRGVDYFEYIKEYLEDYCGFKTKIDFDEDKVDEVEILKGGGTEKDEDWKEVVKEAFNAGIVKVIIGTSTIKEGVNLQERGTVIYHALPEYNPSDIQQLKGRIWRQGNMYGYVRFVVPLIVNSMDAFIWQKLDEKKARLGSIWAKTEFNISDMQSELSPEEIKYSLVESVEEKLKIKLGSEKNKAEYELNLATENLTTFNSINQEIGYLKESLLKAKEYFLAKKPKWIEVLDVVVKKGLPFIEKSENDDKARVKQSITRLRDNINDLITQFNACVDSEWNDPKEVLTLLRFLDQRSYDMPEYYHTGTVKQLYFLFKEGREASFDYDLFYTDSLLKRKITEYWSTIAKAERSIFKPYNKSWNEDVTDLSNLLKQEHEKSKLYLEKIDSEEYKEQLIHVINLEIEESQRKRGSVKDRVDQFKSSNNLLSFLKDNTDVDNCPIPTDDCCSFNEVIVDDVPDRYNEVEIPQNGNNEAEKQEITEWSEAIETLQMLIDLGGDKSEIAEWKEAIETLKMLIEL